MLFRPKWIKNLGNIDLPSSYMMEASFNADYIVTYIGKDYFIFVKLDSDQTFEGYQTIPFKVAEIAQTERIIISGSKIFVKSNE